MEIKALDQSYAAKISTCSDVGKMLDTLYRLLTDLGCHDTAREVDAFESHHHDLIEEIRALDARAEELALEVEELESEREHLKG